MNDGETRRVLCLLFWPVLILLSLFCWFFPETEEEAKKSEARIEAWKLSKTDSLLFGETHREGY